MPVDKLTIEQFAQKVKDKYPQYKDVDNNVLVEKMVTKYPEYRDKINYSTNQPAQQSQPAFQLNISQPTFKSAPTAVPNKTFEYSAPTEATDIIKLQGKARVATENINKELKTNKKALGKVVVADRLREQDKRRQAGIYGPQPTDELFITDDQLSNVSVEAQSDRKRANEVLSAIVHGDEEKSKKVQKDVYLIDAFNNASQDENGNERVKKIEENAKNIEKGDLLYDHNKQILIKPEGFFSSLFEARKELNRVSDDYDRTKLMQDNGNIAAIISDLNAKMKHDPDDPIKVPQGLLGEFGHMLGSQTIKGLTAGSVAAIGTTALGNPEAAPAAFQLASGAMDAVDMYKIGKQNALEQNYAKLKSEHPDMPDYDAYVQANDIAEKQAVVDAAAAGAMQYFGAKVGFGAAKQLGKGLSAGLNQIKDELGKKAFEASGIGGIGAATQVVKNIIAQQNGLNTSTSEGALDAFSSGVLMTGAMAMLGLAADKLKPATRNRLSYGLGQMSDEAINDGLNKLEQSKQLTPEQIENVRNIIKEQKAFEQLIPEDLPETDRLKIGAKIKERSLLKQQIEQVDEAFHPDLKERIKKLNEDIISISKGESRGELQTLVHKAIQNNEVQGFAAEPLRHAGEGELKKYMKEIAEQAHDPNSEATTIATFGKNIVNKAKELYPKETPKESKISVIQPGEIKQPETITIKPQDNAKDVRGNQGQLPESWEAGEGGQNISGHDIQSVPAEPSISGETEQQAGIPAQESSGSGEEIIQEPGTTGITHKQMDAMAEEFGLPTYEKSPEKVTEWDEQATKKLQQPGALDNLFAKLRNGELPDHVETRMMLQYMGDIMAKIDKDPYNRDLQDQLIRTKDLFNIAGRLQGKGLAARKGTIPIEETLGDFLIRDMEANKAPLTDNQITASKKEYEQIKAAKDALEQKVAKMEADAAKAKADKKIQAETKTVKKDNGKDYKAERKSLFDQLKKQKEDHLKSLKDKGIQTMGGGLVLTGDMAKTIAKIIRNYVGEGVTKLDELTKIVHENIKDIIDGISEKDIHDIIAGEYNKPKQTRNDISEKIYDLRTEAKLINRLESLENGEIPKNEKAKIKRSREIEELKQQVKEHDLTKLSTYKKRIQSDIEKLQEQLRKGDFSEPQKSEIKLDAEGIKLKDELAKLKQEREKRIAQLEYENRTRAEKIKDVATNIGNIPRTLMASADLSAPLRQGIVATVAHPTIAAKAFPEMIRQAFSQKQFDRWLMDLKESPEYKLMEDSGLYIADPNNLHLQLKEEQFMSNLGEKIPIIGRIVKGSERGYVAYLNKMRADLFRQGANLFAEQGRTFENSPELYKGLARFINNATGRGGLGPLEQSAQVLNTAFFSPRLIASRLNLINPVFYTKLPKEVRIMALKDMTKTVLFGVTVLGLAKAAGAQVESDPRSSDFGKIKVGNTRWDIWGGFQQYARIFAQLLSGQTKSSNTGEIYDLKGDKFPYKTRLDQLGAFFRGKLAPVPGTAIDLLAGKTVVGEEFDASKKAYELFVPMIAQDIQDAWEDQGIKSLLTVGVPSALGVGVTTYDTKEKAGSSNNGSSKKHEKPTKPHRTNPHKR